MKKIVTASALAVCIALGFLSFLVGTSGAQEDWQAQIAQALGKPGTGSSGGVYRVGLPRTDLKSTLDGVELSRASRSAAGSPSRKWARKPW